MQDADTALDSMVVSYVRFVSRHRLLMLLAVAVPYGIIWLDAGPRAAVTIFALSLLAGVGSYLWGRVYR